MAKTQFENYNSASPTTNLEIQNLKNMTMSSNGKISEGSGSTHSSSSRHNNSGRKSKVATSMRKFLEEEDEFDYLANLTQKSSKTSSRSMAKTSTRKKIPSYRKTKGSPEEAMRSSKHRRPAPVPIPRSSRIKNQTKPKSMRRSSRDMYEGKLKDEKPRESAKTLMASARKLLDKAARAASPGRMRQRSKSPGALKRRNGGQGVRSRSPQSGNTESSDSPDKAKSKSRAKSPGRLKNREVQENEGEGRDGRANKRSESPGRLKKRSQSPGKMKKVVSQNPGALRRPDRPRRKPSRGDGADASSRSTDDQNGEDGRSKRRNGRSNSKGPMRRPERSRSSGPNQGRRDDPPRPAPKTRSTDDLLDGSEGDAPLKKEDTYDDTSRYRVKRNKSMDGAMAHQARRDAQKATETDDDRRTPRRAESMMLSREIGRRGKSNSLANLVQYREEEIHSTSYFASNHVLINRERMKRGLRPLTRNIAMDELARKSAELMASSSGLQAQPTTYVGNVLRGETIRSIHRSTMLQKQGRERANILNPYFQDFGVGTCKGETDGMLYMCQLFSERLQLALTDTATEGGDD